VSLAKLCHNSENKICFASCRDPNRIRIPNRICYNRLQFSTFFWNYFIRSYNGRLKENVAPLPPKLFLPMIVPPCDSIIFLHKYRPKPVPAHYYIILYGTGDELELYIQCHQDLYLPQTPGPHGGTNHSLPFCFAYYLADLK
jgi:hypothetical protein